MPKIKEKRDNRIKVIKGFKENGEIKEKIKQVEERKLDFKERRRECRKEKDELTRNEKLKKIIQDELRIEDFEKKINKIERECIKRNKMMRFKGLFIYEWGKLMRDLMK